MRALYVAHMYTRKWMIQARIEWLRRVTVSDPEWAHARILAVDRDAKRLMREWRGEP